MSTRLSTEELDADFTESVAKVLMALSNERNGQSLVWGEGDFFEREFRKDAERVLAVLPDARAIATELEWALHLKGEREQELDDATEERDAARRALRDLTARMDFHGIHQEWNELAAARAVLSENPPLTDDVQS